MRTDGSRRPILPGTRPDPHPLSAQLLERCKDFDGGFGTLEDACAVLTVYYVDTRYPELNLPFGEQEAKEAIELAAQVVTFVGERIAS